jgi:hypothetical protein
MIRFLYTFVIGTVIACLPGALAYSQPEDSAEMRTKEFRKSQELQNEEAHKLAIEKGISDNEARKQIQAAKKAFQVSPSDLRKPNTKSKKQTDGNWSNGGLKSGKKGKVSLKGESRPKVDWMRNNQLGTQSTPSGSEPHGGKVVPSQKGIDHEHDDSKEVIGKRESAQKHSQHHGHHRPSDGPSDACDEASSREEVGNCKKAHEEMDQLKMKSNVK